MDSKISIFPKLQSNFDISICTTSLLHKQVDEKGRSKLHVGHIVDQIARPMSRRQHNTFE